MEPPVATILVVEDDRATRTFLADNLVADGYDVIEAEGLSEARRLLERAFPDLAIVDLGLEDGNGLDLLSEVRAADRIAGRVDPDLPLLVLSGRVSELDRLRGFDRGDAADLHAAGHRRDLAAARRPGRGGAPAAAAGQ